MNKKVLFIAFLICGCVFSSFSQEESSRKLIAEDANYGQPTKTYNTYKTTWKKNAFKDNWHITVGGGAQAFWGINSTKGNFTDKVTFAPHLSIGKYFSPIWGLRLSFSGGSLHNYNDGVAGEYTKWNNGDKHYFGAGYAGKPGYPADVNAEFITWDPQWNYMYSTPAEIDRNVEYTGAAYRWAPQGMVGRDPITKGPVDANGNKMYYMRHIRYMQANIDFMFDLFNLIGNYNPKRFYELTPYAGIGFYNSFGHLGKPVYIAGGIHGGLISKFRVTDKVGINLELSGSLVPDDFDGMSGRSGIFTMEGIGQVTAGISYKFGKTDWNVAEPTDYELVNSLNNQINDLRAQNQRLVNKKCPECPPAPPVVTVEEKVKEEIVFLPDPVFFKLNKSVIDAGEWSKIEKAAQFLAENPDANVVVTGYADKDTGYPAYNLKLSERRAKTVAQALVQQYGVNPLRISIKWDGDMIQPFKVNSWNRVVIFVIEE